ncbi:carboxylesterase family protein (plasmid) [Neorhizobium galegae]|nr:carboxylesterase family protein [Neorhizobium galegae]
MPFEKLLIAQRDLCNESYEKHDFERDGLASMLGVPFVPVVDGVSLPLHPEDAAALGKTAGVPMMIGCTTGEYVTHATAQPEMDFDLAARLLHQRVLPLGLSGVEIVGRYREALPQHTARGIWRAVGGDLVFQNPATRFARLHAAHQPVYKYLYGLIEPDELGAPHGAEVGEVWYRQGMDVSHLPARQAVKDRTFAAAVHKVWVSFIRDAAPGTPAGRWPRYSPHQATGPAHGEGYIPPPDRSLRRPNGALGKAARLARFPWAEPAPLWTFVSMMEIADLVQSTSSFRCPNRPMGIIGQSEPV